MATLKTSQSNFRAAAVPLLVGVGWLCSGCADQSGQPIRLEPCAAVSEDMVVDVAGVYDYTSPLFNLRGTITFAQEGSSVRVLGTTYAAEDARSLVGEADLVGNRLELGLTPENGDTDYSADVTLVFEDGGSAFCLSQFTDTNDDRGGEGSYRGTKTPAP